MKSNSVNTFHYLAKVEFNSIMDWTSHSFYIRTLSFFHSGIWGKRCHCTFSSQKWKKGQLQQSSNCINPIHWQAYHQHCLPHKQNWSGQWSTQWLAGVNKITIAVEWKNMSNLINKKIHLTIYQTVKADKTTSLKSSKSLKSLKDLVDWSSFTLLYQRFIFIFLSLRY